MRDPRFDQFLLELRRHLKLSPDQSQDVIDELANHAREQLETALAEGLTWEEATARVTAQFASPAHLGREISEAIPPAPSTWGYRLRLMAALLVSGYLFWVIWVFRSYSIGFNGVTFYWCAWFLPLIWALWPGLIWQRNRTATWILGIALAVGLVAMGGGVSSEIQGSPDHPAASLPSPHPLAVAGLWSLVFAGFSVSGFLARRSQQFWAVAIPVALSFILVELPYQWEEAGFRKQELAIRSACEAYHEAHGRWPSNQEAEQLGIVKAGVYEPTYHSYPDRYHVWWVRPLYRSSTAHFGFPERRWVADD